MGHGIDVNLNVQKSDIYPFCPYYIRGGVDHELSDKLSLSARALMQISLVHYILWLFLVYLKNPKRKKVGM